MPFPRPGRSPSELKMSVGTRHPVCSLLHKDERHALHGSFPAVHVEITRLSKGVNGPRPCAECVGRGSEWKNRAKLSCMVVCSYCPLPLRGRWPVPRRCSPAFFTAQFPSLHPRSSRIRPTVARRSYTPTGGYTHTPPRTTRRMEGGVSFPRPQIELRSFDNKIHKLRKYLLSVLC